MTSNREATGKVYSAIMKLLETKYRDTPPQPLVVAIMSVAGTFVQYGAKGDTAARREIFMAVAKQVAETAIVDEDFTGRPEIEKVH